MNRDLDYVLNYMVKYTKDRFMQDSEPMLNHKDIELVLKHIYELQQENKQLKVELQEANDNIIWWSNRFKAVERDNKQLKERIDKAIKMLYKLEENMNKDLKKWICKGLKVKHIDVLDIRDIINTLGDKENE